MANFERLTANRPIYQINRAARNRLAEQAITNDAFAKFLSLFHKFAAGVRSLLRESANTTVKRVINTTLERIEWTIEHAASHPIRINSKEQTEGNQRELRAYVLFQIGMREPAACPLTQLGWIRLLAQLSGVKEANVSFVRVEEGERLTASFRPVVHSVVIIAKLSSVLKSNIVAGKEVGKQLFDDPDTTYIDLLLDQIVVDENTTTISSIANLGVNVWNAYGENSSAIRSITGFGKLVGGGKVVSELRKKLKFLFVNFKVWNIQQQHHRVLPEEKQQPALLTGVATLPSDDMKNASLQSDVAIGHKSLPFAVDFLSHIRFSGGIQFSDVFKLSSQIPPHNNFLEANTIGFTFVTNKKKDDGNKVTADAHMKKILRQTKQLKLKSGEKRKRV